MVVAQLAVPIAAPPRPERQPAPRRGEVWDDEMLYEWSRRSRHRRAAARPQPRRRLQITAGILGPLLIAAVLAGTWLLVSDLSSTRSHFELGRHIASAPSHAEPPTPIAPHSAPSAYAFDTIPRRYMRLYWQAGAEYGLSWSILAAVGEIESEDGFSRDTGVHSGTNPAGAAGPAQILDTTWQRYGVNVAGSQHAGRYNAEDAIMTMAAYLKASGAPENWQKALYTYNHSDAYVAAVLALAARYRG